MQASEFDKIETLLKQNCDSVIYGCILIGCFIIDMIAFMWKSLNITKMGNFCKHI